MIRDCLLDYFSIEGKDYFLGLNLIIPASSISGIQRARVGPGGWPGDEGERWEMGNSVSIFESLPSLHIFQA